MQQPLCGAPAARPYTPARIALHWITAAIILWALASGFTVALFPVKQETRAFVGWLNVSLTTVLIPLFLWRCWLTWRTPATPAKPWPVRLVHGGLYAVTLVVLVSGVLMMERPINVFSWFSLPQPLNASPLTQAIHRLHVASCAVQAALLALHIGAVAWHAWRGQPVLGRMLPGAER